MSPEELRAAVTGAPGDVLLAVDFDGTLAPIVDDPTTAVALPGAVDALARIGGSIGHVAIITGRPPLQAVALGGLRGKPGLERLTILGHYGDQRWDAATDQVVGEPPHESLATARAALPAFLLEYDAADARIEDKDIAVAVHTRGLGPEVFARLLLPLTELAVEHGLHAEPGRQVVELRPPGSDKGGAMRRLVAEFGPSIVIFIGDDLGDLPAFQAVIALREEEGLTGFCVCSTSEEQPTVAALADFVVDGPEGVAAFLGELADAL